MNYTILDKQDYEWLVEIGLPSEEQEDEAIYKALGNVYLQENIHPWKIARWENVEPANFGIHVKVWLSVLPQFELPDYKQGIRFEVPPISDPTEIDIEQLLTETRFAYAEKSLQERAAKWYDQLEIDLYVSHSKAILPMLSLQKHSLSLSGNGHLPALNENLVGLTARTWHMFSLHLPESYHLEKLRGHEVDIHVYIHTVSEPNLASDEALATQLGFENTEAFLTYLYEVKAQDYQQAWLLMLRKEVWKRLLHECDLTLPQALIDYEQERRWLWREKPALQAWELPEETLEKTRRLWMKDTGISRRVAEDLKISVVAKQIAEAQNIGVSAADLFAMASAAAPETYTPAEIREEIATNPEYQTLAEQLLLEKVNDYLYEYCTLTCEGEIIHSPDQTPEQT